MHKRISTRSAETVCALETFSVAVDGRYESEKSEITIILSDFDKAYRTLTFSVKPLVVFFWLPGFV